MTLGEKLQKLRKARGWTQEELAEKVGVSRQSLSKWESDSALPDTANVIVLADLFGVTTDYLLREASHSDTPTPIDASSAPAVVQLIQPQKKAPPGALLTGYILLALGLTVFLGLVLLSNIFPVSVARGDGYVSGVNGFLLAYNLRNVYHLSLLSILIGIIVIIVYLTLGRWVNRCKTPDSSND